MTKGKIRALQVLEDLENHLLNAEASEGQKDILIDIKAQLKEVQEALSYVRLKCK